MIVVATLLALVLPGAAVVIWLRTWRGSRNRRLWLAVLGPAGSAVFILLGLLVWGVGNSFDLRPASGCSSQATHCPTGSMLGTRSDSPISTFGLWIAATALATFVVSLVLSAVTGIIEAIRATRARSTAAVHD